VPYLLVVVATQAQPSERARVDGRSVVASLGPGPPPAFGVDGFGGADLAQQFLRAVRIQEGQQLLPSGQLEQVNQPARTVAQ
jgi:hypothetical protein